MKKIIILSFAFVVTTFYCYSQNCIKPTIASIKSFIKLPDIDSISKSDLIQEEVIHLEIADCKVLRADAYFLEGESFKNILMMPLPTGNLKWINNETLNEAKTPFKLVIGGIWFMNKDGKEELAKDISLIVY